MQRELPPHGVPGATADVQREGVHLGGMWEEIHLVRAGRWDQEAMVAFPATTSRT